MKRLFSCLIVMMLVAVMGTVAAAQGSEDGAEDAAGLAAIVIDAGTCGENLTWTLYDDGELVIEGDGVMYDYGGTSGLRFPWFKYEKLINTVTFGDEVSSVGRQAFCFPSFQDGLEIFPSPYITSINLNNVSSIGELAFSYCTGLNSVSIPESVEIIYNWAFSKCSNLSEVTVYSKTVLFCDYVFDSCSSDLTLYGYKGSTTETYAKENNINFVVIGERAIIASGKCGDELTWTLYDDGELVIEGEGRLYDSYDDNSYSKYRTSIKKVTLGDQVTSINEVAFYNYDEITSIDLANVSSIGKNAFGGCDGLTSIVTPKTVEIIRNAAFYNCSNLTDVTVLNGNVVFEDSVFSWHDNLTLYGFAGSTAEIYANENSFNFIAIDARDRISYGKCGDNLNWILYVDGELVIDGTGEMYDYDSSNRAPWYEYRNALKNITFGNGVASVGNFAFFYGYVDGHPISSPNITSVNLADVQSIGKYAFHSCTGLSSMDFANVKSIGQFSFQECTGLSSLDFASVESIDSGAFYNCTGIASLYFANVKSIASQAFWNCRNVTSIDFTEVCSIAEHAFAYCTKLTEVVIPETVQNIGYRSFSSCPGITKVMVYSRNVTYDDTYANVFFEHHANLTLYGYSDSTTLAYAEKHSIPFLSLDGLRIIASGKCGDNLTWTLYDDKDLVIDGTGTMYNYGIPSVERAPWFEYTDSIANISFGYGVTSIGNNAFSGCSSMPSYINFANITRIGNNAFSDCLIGLESIDLANVVYIEESAFQNSSLNYVFISESVKNIARHAFEHCYLLNIVVDENNENYSSENNVLFNKDKTILIQYPTGIDTSYTVPDTVNSIGENAFLYSFISSIDLNNVTYISDNAFNQCPNLTAVDMPNVTYIGSGAFDYCHSIDSLDLTSVTYIGNRAFVFCSGLTDIAVSESIETICDSAFNYCDNLSKVTIHSKTVEFGGTSVFKDCHSDLTLYGYLGSTTETYAKENNIPFVALDKKSTIASGKCGDELTWTLYDDGELVIEGEGAMYDYTTFNKAPWNSYANDIKECTLMNGVTSIGATAFLRCEALTSISIPDTVEKIGESAFYMSGLTEITIPAGVKSVGNMAFYLCDSLKTVYTPNITAWCNIDFAAGTANPLNYASELYADGIYITDLVIPNETTKIGSYCFDNYDALTSVVIPESVENIGKNAFYECTSLKRIDVNPLNYYYSSDDNGILYNKDKTALIKYPPAYTLTDYTMPESVTSIYEYAFMECKYLKKVTLSKLTVVNKYAFSDCTSLESIVLPENLMTIEQYAFYKCTNLEGITLPSGITNIEIGVFAHCNSLIEVVLPASLKHLKNVSFSACESLTKMTIYSKDVAFGSNTFLNHNADFAIYGYSGSTAETYANSRSIPFIALDECEIIASGKCGDNLTWTLYDDGKLVIEGTGKMYDFSNTDDNLAPWYEYRESILSLVICDGVENLGSYALLNSNVSDIDYGNTVCSVGKYAFANCNMLEIVDIPNNITEILEGAFYNCDGIEFVNISEGVELIGENVFLHCDNIAAFDVDKSNKYYSSDNKGVLFTEGKQKIIRYPSGRDSDKYNIPGTVSEIGPNAFSGCSTLKDIVLPNTITRIEQSAFFECTGIEDIKLGNKISFIGEKAFSGCTGLKTVTIRGNDTILEQNSFDSSDALTLIGYKNSTTEEYADENNIKFSPVTGVKEDKKEKFDIVHDTAGSKAVPVLTGISSTDSCTEVTSCIEAPENCTVAVVNANNQTVDADTVLCSGFKLQTKDADGNVTEEIILVVEGDTDGDGDSTLKDANAAMAEMRRLAEAESGDSVALSADQDSSPVYLIAADLDNDGVVSNVDIKNFLIMASRLTTK